MLCVFTLTKLHIYIYIWKPLLHDDLSELSATYNEIIKNTQSTKRQTTCRSQPIQHEPQKGGWRSRRPFFRLYYIGWLLLVVRCSLCCVNLTISLYVACSSDTSSCNRGLYPQLGEGKCKKQVVCCYPVKWCEGMCRAARILGAEGQKSVQNHSSGTAFNMMYRSRLVAKEISSQQGNP